MTLVDDLKAARSLIDTPRRWRKDGQLAQGRMCIVNAIIEAVGTEQSFGCEDAICEALGADKVGRDVIGDFNDHPSTTHADVLSLIDRAIANAEQKP